MSDLFNRTGLDSPIVRSHFVQFLLDRDDKLCSKLISFEAFIHEKSMMDVSLQNGHIHEESI